MYLTVMFPNSLFIKANIMAGVHIIVYIEAKVQQQQCWLCGRIKLYIMARFNSNLKVYIYVITSINSVKKKKHFTLKTAINCYSQLNPF